MIEGDRVRQVAANAAAHVATDLQAKLAAAQAENGFKLGVALEALRHVCHVLRGGFRAPDVAVAHQFLMLLSKLLPASEAPVGATTRIDAVFCFDLPSAATLLAPPLSCPPYPLTTN